MKAALQTSLSRRNLNKKYGDHITFNYFLANSCCSRNISKECYVVAADLETLLQSGSNNHEITEKLVYNISCTCGTSKLREFYQLVINKNLLKPLW